MRHFLVLAALATLVASPRFAPAAPMPVAPGWTAQQLASGLVTPMGEIAVDPVSHDVFVMDHTGTSVALYRITLSGSRSLVTTGGFAMDVLAFDPVARELFLQSGSDLGRYSETGQLLGMLPHGVTALAIGPDGALYGAYGPMIQRFDRGLQAWQDWRPLNSPMLTNSPDGLSFAPDGAVFVRSGASVFRAEASGSVLVASTLLRMGMGTTATQLLTGPWAQALDAPAWPANSRALWVNDDGVTGLISGVASDPDGRIFMTAIGSAMGQGSVWVFTPPAAVPVHTSTWGQLKSRYR